MRSLVNLTSVGMWKEGRLWKVSKVYRMDSNNYRYDCITEWVSEEEARSYLEELKDNAYKGIIFIRYFITDIDNFTLEIDYLGGE